MIIIKRIILVLTLVTCTAWWGFPVVSAESIESQVDINVHLAPHAEISVEKPIEGNDWYLGSMRQPPVNQGPFIGKAHETRWAEAKLIIMANTDVLVSFSAQNYPTLNGVEFPINGYVAQLWDPDPGFELPFYKGIPTSPVSISNRLTRWKVFAEGTIPEEFWTVPAGTYLGAVQVTVSPING